jgi:hypothetical protein
MTDPKQAALDRIAECVERAKRALLEAENIATDAGVNFHWKGPGTQGSTTFYGDRHWRDSGCSEEGDDPQWFSSTDECADH